MNLVDVFGWTGAALILIGFYRVSVGKWSGKSLWYEFDNLTGSALLIIYAISKHAPVAIILNAVWFLAALKGISSIHNRVKTRNTHKKK